MRNAFPIKIEPQNQVQTNNEWCVHCTVQCSICMINGHCCWIVCFFFFFFCLVLFIDLEFKRRILIWYACHNVFTYEWMYGMRSAFCSVFHTLTTKSISMCARRQSNKEEAEEEKTNTAQQNMECALAHRIIQHLSILISPI